MVDIVVTLQFKSQDGKLPSLMDVERAYMKKVIELCDGSMSHTVRHLEIGHTTYYRKLEEMGIPVRRIQRKRA